MKDHGFFYEMVYQHKDSQILYLREPTMIEVAEIHNQGYHFWIEIKDYIDLDKLENHEIRFTYFGKQYIYWADMSIFLKRFYTVDEVRNNKINELLKR